MRFCLAVAASAVILAVSGHADQTPTPAAPAPASAVLTNSVGMEFIRIEPGTMQVGVFHPDCANGARAGGPGPGRAEHPTAAGGRARRRWRPGTRSARRGPRRRAARRRSRCTARSENGVGCGR